MNDKEIQKNPKEGKFWLRIIIILGWALCAFIMITLLIRIPALPMKVVGLAGSIISIWLGYVELNKIKNKKERK